MTTFTVWKFDEPDGASRAEAALEAAAGDGLVTIVDHAVLSWAADADKPDLRHKHDSGKRGAGWGALWGILGGALFFVPVAGAVIGAGIGALAKATDGTTLDRETVAAHIVNLCWNGLAGMEAHPVLRGDVDGPAAEQGAVLGAGPEADPADKVRRGGDEAR